MDPPVLTFCNKMAQGEDKQKEGQLPTEHLQTNSHPHLSKEVAAWPSAVAS